MRVINPQPNGDSIGATRTLTQRLKEFAPRSAELIDGGFLLLAGTVALLGFATTFDTWHFLLVGIVGLVLGMAVSFFVMQLRWNPGAVPGLLLLAYFGLGPFIAARDVAFLGFLPTLDALGALVAVMTTGWKEMLTTLPPLVGDGEYLAIPYALALVAGAVGLWVARKSSRAALPALVPLGLLAAVIALGTVQAPGAIWIGLALAVLLFGWTAVRTRRRRRLAGTGRSHQASLAIGAGLVAVAVLGAAGVGAAMPGASTERFVLRSYVQPPVDLKDVSSPLVGFRKYSSVTTKRLYDAPLLTVTGARSGALLRFAVLDSYAGHTWSASGGSRSDSGFQRLGARIPSMAVVAPQRITVTFAPGYEQTRELSNWLPSLGDNTEISFGGVNAKAHQSSLRYNLETGQGLLIDGDRFRAGDEVSLFSAPAQVGFDASMSPGGGTVVDPASYSFLAATAQKWAGDAPSAGERVMRIAATLKAGYWSDGTRVGEAEYLPGHSQARLASFVDDQYLVGSDEQYAATFGLLCNQAGFPTRVVFGAAVPQSGQITGKDVTAWVEVFTDEGWRVIPANMFTPDRSRIPPQRPQTITQQKRASNVPPPNVTRTQNNSVGMPDNDLSGSKLANAWWMLVLKWLWGVIIFIGRPLLVVAAVLLAIVAAKYVRGYVRRRRGTPSRQIVGAWSEVFDRCRDLGALVSQRGTRLEQSQAIGIAQVTAFAEAVNAASFGAHDPTEESVAALWLHSATVQAGMIGPLSWSRRWAARVNPRSLLPESIATRRRPKLPPEVYQLWNNLVASFQQWRARRRAAARGQEPVDPPVA